MSGPAQPLVHSLLANARAHPGRTALLAGGQAISFGEFRCMISAVASRLRARGLGAGQQVLICGPNGPYVAAAYFAVHSVGGVAVPLGADTPGDAARLVAEDCAAALALLAVELTLPIPCEDLRSAACPEEGRQPIQPVCRMDDPADILYTTGTAGRKKGVVLNHDHITQAATNTNAFIQNGPGDVEVVPIPLNHSFGLGRLRCMAQTGNTLVLEPGLRNAAKCLKRVLDLKATGLALVPAGFDLILRMTDDRLGDARDHLRYIEIGSAPMRLETKQRLMELLPRTRICHHFGLTEASRAAFIEYHADRRKLASIGRPSPNVEISIRDEQGRELPPGEQGELVIRGRMVMKEYFSQPELTSRVLQNGWLRSGDWGYKDRDGYLHLLGRRQDLINVGGLKVSPEEIEQLVNQYEGVIESACVGVPDPQGITGDCVKAFIVSQSDVTRQELVTWLRGRLEEYKIPRLLERV
ncbi:MAG: class I adenylate-forming enzyme family protein, partial [Planctomycetota bacterium]